MEIFKVLQNSSVRLRLMALAIASVALMAVLGLFAIFTVGRLSEVSVELVTAGRAIRNHMEADMMHDAVRSDVLTALAARSAADLQTAGKDLTGHLEVFQSALKRNAGLALPAEIRSALVAIEPDLQAYGDSATALVAAASHSRSEAWRLYPDFLRAFESLEERNAAATELIEAEVRRTEGEEAAQAARARWILVVGMALTLAAMVLMSWLVGRGVTHVLRAMEAELGATAERLTAAASQVAAASGAMADGASFQASSMISAVESSNEVSATARANAENCRQSAEMVETLSTRAGASRQVIEQLNEAMEAIAGSSEKVSRIVKQIEEIAFQTNLLALNASVEAARAGSAGAGFAVVADEVRNLAQRSTASAKETAALIEESSHSSSIGRERVREVASVIGGLLADFGAVRGRIEEINAASQEQLRGIEQVAGSVGRIQDVTQRNAASAEENAAVSRELEGQAKGLTGMVSELKALAR